MYGQKNPRQPPPTSSTMKTLYPLRVLTLFSAFHSALDGSAKAAKTDLIYILKRAYFSSVGGCRIGEVSPQRVFCCRGFFWRGGGLSTDTHRMCANDKMLARIGSAFRRLLYTCKCRRIVKRAWSLISKTLRYSITQPYIANRSFLPLLRRCCVDKRV